MSQGIAITAQAGGRCRDGRCVTDVGDTPMPARDEMGHGVEGGAVVIYLDEIRRQAGRRPVDEHDRHAEVEPGMVRAGRAEQQAGDAPLHHAPDDVALHPGSRRVLVTSTDRPWRDIFQLHRVDDLGEERVGDGFHDEPDRGVRARAQATGPSHRARTAGRALFPDALTGDRRDPRIVVQDPRSRYAGSPGCVRDVEQPGGSGLAIDGIT